MGELSATVQSCVSLWEGAFALADVQGTDLITRRNLALFARMIALRGEAAFVIRGDRLLPVADWELSTRQGNPRACRVSISEVGGSHFETVLAGEVVHVAVGSSAAVPCAGTSPLHLASLTAELLQEVETALRDVYRDAPIGSQVVPFPETGEADLASLARGFRGRRGRILMRESVNVQAAGGPTPAQDWAPQGTTPDLTRVMPREVLQAAPGAVMAAYGVLPALFTDQAQGPLAREAQRYHCQWCLQLLAMLLAEEISDKTGAELMIDTLRPSAGVRRGRQGASLRWRRPGAGDGERGGPTDAQNSAARTHVNWGPNDGAA